MLKTKNIRLKKIVCATANFSVRIHRWGIYGTVVAMLNPDTPGRPSVRSFLTRGHLRFKFDLLEPWIRVWSGGLYDHTC